MVAGEDVAIALVQVGIVPAQVKREHALGIRPIDFEVIVDPGRDGGVRRRGAQILQVERHQFAHAVLMFDYEGSGAAIGPTDLEASLAYFSITLSHPPLQYGAGPSKTSSAVA